MGRQWDVKTPVLLCDISPINLIRPFFFPSCVDLHTLPQLALVVSKVQFNSSWISKNIFQRKKCYG